MSHPGTFKNKINNLLRILIVLAPIAFLVLNSVPASSSGKKIRVGIYDNKPLVFVDSDGSARGLFADILGKIASRENWNIEYVHESWPRCLEMLRNGKIDLLMPIAYSRERDIFLDFTKETILANWARIYTGKGTKISSILDLKGKRIAVLKDDIYSSNFREILSKFNGVCDCLVFESYDAVALAVYRGEADAALLNRLNAIQYEDTYHLVPTPVLLSPVKILFAVSEKKNHDILEAIDRNVIEFKQQKDSIYYQSLAKWLGREKAWVFPIWIKWFFISFAGLIIVVFAGNALLRQQVRVKTRKLVHEIERREKAEKALREKEGKLRTIFEAAKNVSFIVIDTAGEDAVIKEFSAGAERIFGYTRKEVIGKPAVILHTPEDVKNFPEIVDNIRRGKKGFTGESTLVRKSGKTFPALFTTYPLFDDDGQVVGIVAIAIDITEQKRAEEKIRASEEFLSNVFESIQDGISVLDKDLTIRRVNSVMETWYAPNVPLEGKKCFACYHNRDAACEFCPTLRCFESGHTEREIVPGLPGLPTEWLELFSYPVKDQASGEIRGAVEFVRDITERKRIERALEESEEKYRLLIDNASDAIFIAQDDVLKFHNPMLETLSGYSKRELYNKPFQEKIHPDDRDLVLERYRKRLQGDDVPHTYSFRIIHKSGKDLWLQLSATRIMWEGKPATLNFARDITGQKRIKEQLYQAQKMEAVGRLAGGIAHDFNNLLTTIIGFSDLITMDLDKETPIRSDVEEIRKAAKRASSLTSQLLAFSRRQMLQPKVLNLNTVTTDIEKILKRTIGEDIQLVTILDGDLGLVKADRSQIEQVIMNLAINARDAMPGGGKLTIETKNVELDENYAQKHTAVTPGAYVLFAMTDTGIGMDNDTQAHIFEPFFTTKDKTKGTGLGLAMVYGIVKQSGGNIWVYSEPGEGTTFKIYLPRVEGEIESVMIEPLSPEDLRGTETILLVEDEDKVRELARRVLNEAGYTVLDAKNGGEALNIAKQPDIFFHLLVTDVVMPQMNGKELARSISNIKPELKVIYMSGYTDNIIVENGMIGPEISFLQKPFSPISLLQKVREVLDSEKDD